MADNTPGSGDQIKVGDIVGSIGVAIGRGARATVNVFRDQEELRHQRDRLAMLNMVRDFWVAGVLEKSLYQTTLIKLALEIRNDAVDNQQWQSIGIEAVPGAVIAGKDSVVEVFYALNELNRTLLILGAPGCGKTTMLLDLARHAIRQAQDDPAQPIPAVFNLSSWSVKQKPIAAWLVDELNDKYIVPRKIGQPWVEEDQLLLLLDGLDEVETQHQAACIRALNHFNQESRMPIVICCRDDEYEVLPLRLRLQAAVFLKPLTPEQIEAYVGEETAELAALAEALRTDPQLHQLAQTPLILNTMMRAYQGMPLQTLENLDSATARRYLFDAYVQRMFQRSSLPHHFPQEKTIQWLSWLARKMERHSQAIFLIERIQPDWLSTPGQRRLHVLLSRLAISLPSGLVGGLILGLGFALFFGPPREGLVRGLGEGLLSCLIGGLAVVLIDVARLEWGDRVRAARQIPPRAQLALNILIVTLAAGVSVWLGIGFILGEINWLGYGAALWWLEGSLVGLLVGLSFGFIFGFGTRGDRQLLTEDVQTVEYLSWSPATAVVGAIYGLVAGVVSGLILWLSGLQSIAAVSLIFAEGRILWVAIPVLTLAGAIFGGLRGSIVQSPTKANQGIRLSLFNAAVMGSTAGLTFAVIGALLGGLSAGQTAAITLAAYGLFFGLLAAIWYGGFDVIKHAALRFILYRHGAIPLRYAHFLDYAAERVFLRKVGGGYIFIHRLLADHFAAMVSVQTGVVNLELAIDFYQFTLEEQSQFIVELSRIINTNPDDVCILDIASGSVKIILEMPEEAALVLLSMFLAGESKLKALPISKVELIRDPMKGRVTSVQVDDRNKSPTTGVERVNMAKLREFTANYFNETELRDICFDLRVDYESLPGQGKRDRARELVAFLERRGRIDEFVSICYRLRPTIDVTDLVMLTD